jgi:hypothetical protein
VGSTLIFFVAGLFVLRTVRMEKTA